MNRRSFFKFAGAAVAGIALEQAIPLGRVWSFPSKIKRFAFDPSDFTGLSSFNFYDLETPSKPIYPIFETDYYAIEWPVVSREWQFGVYMHEVLTHYGQLQNMKAIALEAA